MHRSENLRTNYVSLIVILYCSCFSIDYGIPSEGWFANGIGLGFLFVSSFLFLLCGCLVYKVQELYGIKKILFLILRVYIYSSIIEFVLVTLSGSPIVLFQNKDVKNLLVFFFIFTLIAYYTAKVNKIVLLILWSGIMLLVCQITIFPSVFRYGMLMLLIFLWGYRFCQDALILRKAYRIAGTVGTITIMCILCVFGMIQPESRYIPMLTTIFQNSDLGKYWMLLFFCSIVLVSVFFSERMKVWVSDSIEKEQGGLIANSPQLFIFFYFLVVISRILGGFLPNEIIAVAMIIMVSTIYLLMIKFSAKYYTGNWFKRDIFQVLPEYNEFLKYKCMKSRKEKHIVFFSVYTCAFLLVGIFVFSFFLQTNRSFLWYPDGIQSYYEAMVFYRSTAIELWEQWKNTRTLSFPMFDFSIGLGKDVTARMLGIFIDPFDFLAMFCPYEKLVYLMNIRTILYIYLSGMMFNLYFQKISNKVNVTAGVIGALTYAFCGYSLFGGIRHPVMQLMMLLLPVLLYSIEKVLRKEGITLLVLVVFYGCISEIYAMYIVTIIAVFYTIIRYIFVYHDGRIMTICKRFSSCFLGYLIGFLLAGIVWVPKMLFTYLPSGRIGSTSHIAVDSFLFYSIDYYKSMFMHLTGGYPYIDLWTVMGVPATVIVGIILLWSLKRKHIRWLKWEFIIFLIMLCVPAFGYITSGFSSISNRFSFSFAFICALIIGTMIGCEELITKRHIQLLFAAIMVYSFILVYITKLEISGGVLASFLLLLLVLSGLLLLMSYDKIHYYKMVLVLCTIISICLNAYYLFSTKALNYSSQFIKNEEAEIAFIDEGFSDLAEYLGEQDPDFYRCSSNTIALDSNGCAKMFRLNGLSGFNSAEIVYNNYLIEHENSGIYDSTVRLGMDNRYILLEQAAVKYSVVDRKNINLVPYNYSIRRIVSHGDGTSSIIAENTKPLSLGYTYDSYILQDEYEQLDAIKKQELLLHAAVLQKEAEQKSSMDVSDITFNSKIRQLTGLQGQNLAWNDGMLTVGTGNGILYVDFEKTDSMSEVYVRLVGYETSRATISVNAVGEGVNTSTTLTSKDNLYTTVTDGRIMNLGYHIGGISNVTLIFNNAGTYGLGDLEIWEIPMKDLDTQIEQLKSEELENVKIAGNQITGEIEVTGDKFLCLSIPNSSIHGWTAYVDNEEVELEEANSLYMGFWLTEGKHTIRMEYKEPGFEQGAFVSIIGCVTFLVYLVWFFRKRRKRQFMN